MITLGVTFIQNRKLHKQSHNKNVVMRFLSKTITNILRNFNELPIFVGFNKSVFYKCENTAVV